MMDRISGQNHIKQYKILKNSSKCATTFYWTFSAIKQDVKLTDVKFQDGEYGSSIDAYIYFFNVFLITSFFLYLYILAKKKSCDDNQR